MNYSHEQDVQEIQKRFLELHNVNKSCTLQNHSVPSNITRGSSYKTNQTQININHLNRILSVDPVKRVAYVEPRVTMEQLAESTIKHGLIPPVVPEFKNITVGGAIMGTAIESSSHHFGLFSDNCLSYEVLLGDGSIIRVSPKEHPDLFYGIPGSYGSLGIILSAEIQLLTAPAFIKLTYRRFSQISEALSHLHNMRKLNIAPPFVEGILYSKDNIVIIEGTPCTDDTSLPLLSLKESWSPWFYQHVNEVAHEEEKIAFIEYLFRHDRGAFWMGAYATYPSLYRSWLRNKPFQKPPKDPGKLFRLLLGWAMTSKRMYSVLHSKAEEWASNQFIIQDFFLPFEEAEAFVNKVLDETQITPLWLCPVAGTSHPQILTPHSQKNTLLIDVGIYGVPQNNIPSEKIKSWEKWVHEHQARKMLYAYSYYSKDEFWEVYPRKKYEELRHRYHANAWMRIDDKVI